MIGGGLWRAAAGASVAIWLAAAAAALAIPVEAPDPSPAATRPARLLLVLLDSVPYDLVAELTDRAAGEAALFRDFAPPVPLISTFPSSTSVAVPGLLSGIGVEPSPGYEARFFDWRDRRVRGGGAISYFRIEFPWREFFDFSGKGAWRSAFAALRPVEASIGRLDRALEAFVASEAPRFTVYVETTDTAAHLDSPRSLEPVLGALDRSIGRLRRAHPERPFGVILLSDHGIAGGAPLVNTVRAVKRAARAAGFRLTSRLRHPDDLVLTPYGLVSSFEAYAEPGRGARAAAALAAAEGVDLCVTPAVGERALEGERAERGASEAEAAEGSVVARSVVAGNLVEDWVAKDWVVEGWIVEGVGGRALVERRRDGARALWRYRPLTGDPLGYAEIAARLAADGSGSVARGDGGGGWFDDSRWLAASAEHRYPDALYRLAHAFELVENPATVVCSVAPGHMYGPVGTEMAARWTQGALRWTHGALSREASWGFLLTDLPGLVDRRPLRFDQGLARLLPVAKAAAVEVSLPNPRESQ